MFVLMTRDTYENLCCWYSFEAPRWGYLMGTCYMFSWIKKSKNTWTFRLKEAFYLELWLTTQILLSLYMYMFRSVSQLLFGLVTWYVGGCISVTIARALSIAVLSPHHDLYFMFLLTVQVCCWVGWSLTAQVIFSQSAYLITLFTGQA